MYKKLLFIGGVGVLVFISSLSVAHAADPQCMITWESQNHAPRWFVGKIIPIRQSYVRVYMEAISQNTADQGKLLDLSNKEVRWYLNGDLVRKGNGMQELTIANNDLSGSDITGKVAFSYYDPTDGSVYFPECQFSIPVTTPFILIPGSGTYLPANATSTVTAVPFFFNVADQFLSVSWTVNGQQVSSADAPSFALPLSIPAGASGQVQVNVSAVNNDNLFEQGSASASFSIAQ